MKHINPEPSRRDCDGILKPARKGVVLRLMRSLLKTKGEILAELNQLKQGISQIMATLDDIQVAQAVTDTKIAAVSADVAALIAKIAAIPLLGMTPEQQAAVDAIAVHANAINDALTGVDASANPAAAPTA